MKKILSFCLLISMICSVLLVITIYQTKDRARINEIERTPNSFNFYLKDSNRTLNEEISFFKKLAKEEKVSIFKTDEQKGTIIKSVIFNRASFPFEQFGLKNEELFHNQQNIYTSFSTNDTHYQGEIPVFWKKNRILLQSFENEKNQFQSTNGTYSVVSKTPMNQERVAKRFAEFFNVEPKKLLTSPFSKAIGYNIRMLLLFSFFLFTSFLVVVIINVYAPLTKLKTIGVKKLNGMSDWLIFWESMKQNLLFLFASSLIIDGGIICYFRYRPAHFFLTVCLVQVLILCLYLLTNFFVYLVIKKVTLNMLVKQFLGFKYGMISCFAVKGLLILFTTMLLLQISQVFGELSENYARSHQWEKTGNFLVLERCHLSDEDFHDLLSEGGKVKQKLVESFFVLEKQVNARYVFHEQAKDKRTKSNYEIMHVNENFLKTLSVNYHPLRGEVHEFLIPDSFRKDKKNICSFCQKFIFEGMSADQKSGKQCEEIPVKLHYYNDTNFSVFSYNKESLKELSSPIILLFNEKNMSDFEKSVLQNTAEKNPIKIVNSEKNQEKLQKFIRSAPMNQLNPKFSTVQSIVSRDIREIKLWVTILISLSVIIFCLDLLSLLFLLTCMIQGKKKQLSVYRLLGVKLFDRYRVEFLLFGGFYLIQFAALLLFGKTWVMLLFALGLIGIEVFVIGWVIGRKEQKNLALLLKGE